MKGISEAAKSAATDIKVMLTLKAKHFDAYPSTDATDNLKGIQDYLGLLRIIEDYTGLKR